MEPFISKIDYEVPILKNYLKNKNYDKIKKNRIFETYKVKENSG